MPIGKIPIAQIRRICRDRVDRLAVYSHCRSNLAKPSCLL
ncbi:hypothetical protein H4W29_002682 [Rhizobium viscosum]|uniref:Integrase n=1 Tax=Rhizobium viscosum TaxID=1673 RepID=A0ABR9IQM3_RHIVS|nr:hypothetical protein [Rhizobium viscosum]